MGDKLMEVVEGVLNKVGLDGVVERFSKDPVPVDIKAELATMFQAVEENRENLDNGIQFTEIIPILSAALHDIMELAENMTDATGQEKLEFVKATFIGLYNFIDKGIDGDKNRIDIPWVPEFVENFIEARVLPTLVHFGVEAVVTAWNKH